MTDASRLKATIYVGGLDNDVTERVLADAFLPFGEIVHVTIPKPEQPSSTELHRGFGYVEYDILGDANEALVNMDQSELFGRVIKVAAAKPQKDSNEGIGSKTAIWEQEGWLAKHAVAEEDRRAIRETNCEIEVNSEDPVQSLEGLDVAGPKQL